MDKYVLGLDYGTDSCRATLVSTADGRELDSEVFYYPRGKGGNIATLGFRNTDSTR